jgi:hypothetical protein
MRVPGGKERLRQPSATTDPFTGHGNTPRSDQVYADQGALDLAPIDETDDLGCV